MASNAGGGLSAEEVSAVENLARQNLAHGGLQHEVKLRRRCVYLPHTTAPVLGLANDSSSRGDSIHTTAKPERQSMLISVSCVFWYVILLAKHLCHGLKRVILAQSRHIPNILSDLATHF